MDLLMTTEPILPCGLTETELRKRVDIERTINELGIDPRELLRTSKVKTYAICHSCGRSKGQLLFDTCMANKVCRPCSQDHVAKKTPIITAQEIIDKRILVQRTIELLHVDPRKLSTGSSRRVIATCKTCGIERSVELKSFRDNCGSCAGKLRPPVSEETRKKLSIFRTGKSPSEETRQKISKKNKERTGALTSMFGRKHSEETKKKMSEKQTGKSPSIETREKIRKVRTGTKASEETKRRMSESAPKTPRTEEVKRKISEKQKGKPRLSITGKKHPFYGKPRSHGRGFWYLTQDGYQWMRSTWEGKFADKLTEDGKEWKYEPQYFEITYTYEGKEKEGTYTPDFLVDGEWFEVKSWWAFDAYEKFMAFKEQYPEEKINLIMGDEMEAMGLKPKETAESYLARSPHCSLKKPS